MNQSTARYDTYVSVTQRYCSIIRRLYGPSVFLMRVSDELSLDRRPGAGLASYAAFMASLIVGLLFTIGYLAIAGLVASVLV